MTTAPSSAHRAGAPGALPRSSVVRRDALVDRLGARFDARLTTIVGGAGIGKTTLLAQALRTDGERIDIWYPCTRADRTAGRLLARLADAVADGLDEYRPDGRADPLAALVESIVATAPDRVCLVLDDVHVLDDAAPLDELLAALPANGHLLLSGRRLPGVSTARIDALGGLLRIQESELLLTDAELVEFARLRHVDADVLAAAERWPAFVELASRGGGTTPQAYLAQEVLPALDDERRAGLARFAFVGGGDDEIARAVTGRDLDDLVAGIPLVRWSGGRAQLHDLWIDLLHEELTDAERSTAAAAAAAIHRERGDVDGAIVVHSAVGDDTAIVDAIGAAIRDGVDGGLAAAELRRWLSLLPGDTDDAVITLARGVIERERDPTAPRTADLLQAAADGFRRRDDPTMELVATLQLGYVARVSGDPRRLTPVIERIGRLADAHPPARPFRAFADAWAALVAFDNQAQLDALLAIADAELPPVWAASRDHLIANALFGLGRPDEAVEWAPDVEALDIPVPGALATKAQCLWHAGRPAEAIATPAGTDGRHGARDRVIGSAWTAAMHAWTGRIDLARDALDAATRAAGELESDLTQFQLAGVGMIIDISAGREEQVAEFLEPLLVGLEYGLGPIEQTLRLHVVLPYVLVPSSRPGWERLPDRGPAIARMLDVARAFTALRDGDPSFVDAVDWTDPAQILVAMPTVWSIEFGLRAIDAGEERGGRRLVTWLCEHWGDPAHAALRRWADDAVLGPHARALLATTPMPPRETIAVEVLGRCRLSVDGAPSDDPDWRRERVRALLVWLLVHRSGGREQIAGALWPDLPPDRAARNLRTTLNYLHGVLEPGRSSRDATWFVRIDGSSIELHPSLDVDMWRFTDRLAEAEGSEAGGRVSDALPLLVDAVSIYAGDLAPDLDHPWLDLERIHLRSRFVRASCRAAELLVAKRRADEAVDIAKDALAVDPYHAASYVALGSAYEAVGDLTSARAVRAHADAQLGDL